MPLFSSIESKHGVDEPDQPPRRESFGARMEATGAKLQGAGNQMSSCGGSLVKLGCFGFLVLVVVAILVSALLGGSSSSSSPSTPSAEPAKTNCEHPSAAEPCAGRALEEWHREHGETPLRVQEGKEAPDETEQKNREAKEKEVEVEKEAIREGQRLKSEGKAEEEEAG